MLRVRQSVDEDKNMLIIVFIFTLNITDSQTSNINILLVINFNWDLACLSPHEPMDDLSEKKIIFNIVKNNDGSGLIFPISSQQRSQ